MVEVGREFFIFLYAVLAGIFLMFSYELLQLFRRLILHKLWVINVEDVLFWLLTSFYLFRRMYRTTNGSIRWFFVSGIFLGAGVAWYICYKGSRYFMDKKNIEKKNKRR